MNFWSGWLPSPTITVHEATWEQLWRVHTHFSLYSWVFPTVEFVCLSDREREREGFGISEREWVEKLWMLRSFIAVWGEVVFGSEWEWKLSYIAVWRERVRERICFFFFWGGVGAGDWTFLQENHFMHSTWDLRQPFNMLELTFGES